MAIWIFTSLMTDCEATLFLDVDNDSWLDAYLATWGTSTENADQFYINQQDGTSLAVSESSGIQTLTR